MRGNYSRTNQLLTKEAMIIRVTLESPYYGSLDNTIIQALNFQADTYSCLASTFNGEEIGREWDMQNYARSLILNFDSYNSADGFLGVYFEHDEQWDVIQFCEIKEEA